VLAKYGGNPKADVSKTPISARFLSLLVSRPISAPDM
jgi:hypothetical protein